jgi:mycothiol synthase
VAPSEELAPTAEEWSGIDAAVPVELVQLARRCLAVDGGLPLVAEPWFLRRRWSAVGALRFGLRDALGDLLAAGVVCPGADGPIVTGLVDPSVRGRGVGARLLDHVLARADSLAAKAGGVVTVETEAVTPESGTLFESRQLRLVFAEEVLRIDPAGVGAAVWPSGSVLTPWSDREAGRFFRVYEAAFRDRPGFPGTPRAEWIADNEYDDDFRPDWSVLVQIPGIGDAGFVTAAAGWIVQAGVVPAARGHGLGRALVTEALHRMAADGGREAWLTVNVDNPGALRLYRRLGFTDRGRRARYRH